MNTVFADTSFYVAFVSPQDGKHAAAVAFAKGFNGVMVTSHYVLLELGSFLARVGDRVVFVDLLDRLRADPMTIVVSASDEIFVRGSELFRARLDKNWSLTDCISFGIMRDQGLREVLTADHHFRQAGFEIALR